MKKASALLLVLLLVAVLPAAGLARGPSSVTAPQDYAPTVLRPDAAAPQVGMVCVFKDVNPWGSVSTETILADNGIPYEIHTSGEFATLDFDGYGMIVVSSDQTQAFYDAYATYATKFEDYVATGGFLAFFAADQGWNGGVLNAPLPGGMTYALYGENYDYVDDPAHPTMAGIPNPFYGSWASHGVFDNLPPNAHVIAHGETSGAPMTVEYPIGAGWFIGLAETLEISYDYGWEGGPILPNTLLWGYAWSAADPVFATHVRIVPLGAYPLLLGIVRAATDDGATPVPGAAVDVQWTLPIGGGYVIPQTKTTNANGLAFPVMLSNWSGTYILDLVNITAEGFTYDPDMNWESSATYSKP